MTVVKKINENHTNNRKHEMNTVEKTKNHDSYG